METYDTLLCIILFIYDMRKNLVFLLLSSLLVLASCTKEKAAEIANTITSLKTEKCAEQKIELDPQWGIESLAGVKDSDLICKSTSEDHIFYVLSGDRYTLKKTFGVKGNAANEWIAPHLLFAKQKGLCYVLDNGSRKIHTLKDYQMTSKAESPIKGIANLPKLYGDFICYTDETPNKLILRLNNFKTNEPIDSIAFEDNKKKGLAYLEGFVYDMDENVVVIAHCIQDRFEICNLSSKQKLIPSVIVKGSGETDENEYTYYSSAVVYQGKIYLLSQRHVSLSKMNGYSSVEVYDFKGKAIKNIALNFIASQMVYNPLDSSMLLLSATDGSLVKAKL